MTLQPIRPPRDTPFVSRITDAVSDWTSAPFWSGVIRASKLGLLLASTAVLTTYLVAALGTQVWWTARWSWLWWCTVGASIIVTAKALRVAHHWWRGRRAGWKGSWWRTMGWSAGAAVGWACVAGGIFTLAGWVIAGWAWLTSWAL